MILNRVYEDFMVHTNLTDPMYKSVFQKISDTISSLNDIKWKRMIYTMNGHVYDIDFEVNRVLPVHIIDLLQNVFEHNFLFPAESTTILQLEYKNIDQEIRVENGITKIPRELDFLMYSKLFSFFYVSHPTNNIYSEFDKLFQFINSFKIKPVDVFSSLKKQFDGEFVESEIKDNGISQDDYFETSMLIESLESKRSQILSDLEDIKKKKEDIIRKQNGMKNGVANRERLLKDQSLLKDEFKLASEAHSEYEERINSYEDLVKELVESIEGTQASINIINQTQDKTEEHLKLLETYEQDLKFFVEKRLIFDKELLSIKKMYIDSQRLIKDLQTRLTTIGNDLVVIEGYSTVNVDKMEQEVYNLNKDYDTLYGELVTLNHDIETKKSKMKKDNDLLSKSSSLMDVNIQLLEKKDIADHLSKPLQPQSVIVVENYLRYYFVYYTQKAIEAVGETELEQEWINTIMARKVLETYFGVQPYTLFSAIQFNPKSVKNFINISKV